MRNQIHYALFFWALIIGAMFKFENISAQTPVWQQYVSPSDAGFDTLSIKRAKLYFDSLGAASILVIYKGHVLIQWGDNTRRYMCASVRKSFLSALIGIEIQKGTLRLSQTLRELNFTDRIALTESEMGACVSDLLTSRSGVYIPAAYEAKVWKDRRPERDSHAPGTFWYYNNWDFNVLGRIYENVSHLQIGEAFNANIAKPLDMEDFRLNDVKNFYENNVSMYPAYTFKMSARDMARFGLLYLQKGLWKEKRIISEKWIQESTEPKYMLNNNEGYGYLWWSTYLDESRVFYASGAGVQGIYIVPDKDIVFVFRVNTYGRAQVSDGKELKLLSMLLEAKTQKEQKKPKITMCSWIKEAIPPTSSVKNIPLRSDVFGRYTSKQFGTFELLKKEKEVVLQTGPVDFRIFPQSDSTFYIEDLHHMGIVINDSQKQGHVEFKAKEQLPLLIFYKP